MRLLRAAAGLDGALVCPGLAPDPRSGGDATVFDASVNAFGQPAPNLPFGERPDFFTGNALFNRNWVTAPSSTVGSDGLGPIFNAASCSACHFKDGRGRPPIADGEAFESLVVRLSVPGDDASGGSVADPRYGRQLGNRSILGVPAEGAPRLVYEERAGSYDDGAPYRLRAPHLAIDALAYGPLAPDVLTSVRTAQQIVGLGLLAAVDEATLLAHADPDDGDGDGISGRPNLVWDRRRGEPAVGRFGWKASTPTIEQQTAGAFVGDIGITSPLFESEDCTAAEAACADAPNGGVPEIDQLKLDLVTFYVTLLAVPARRDVDDPIVRRGEALFAASGCASCHVPTLATGELAGFPAVSGQTIHPYTDLLLHDLGPDLADGRPDHLASGSEWRTPPLWGLGLVLTVNDHLFLLHDGRARGFAEAVLWHGGEATSAREAFRALPADDRAALVRFLESL
ncbi:MAG: thiol oxidoreductase [Deltaproteobacteria bacterium]|nr:thiol oxidoreductase [Deltaproteobacteria bacterium]